MRALMTTTRPLPTTQSRDRARPCEPGFTLIEALIAVIILVFGLIAVAQLLAVAASSNSTANRSSAAAAAASQELERLQTVSFASLPTVTSGSVDNITATSPATPCAAGYYTDRQIPGVGTVRTCWKIDTVSGTTNTNLRFITVRAQVLGPFSALTRAEFTTFRSLNGSTPTPTPVVTP